LRKKRKTHWITVREGGRNFFVGLISAIEIADLGVNRFH
jgi:hypothetical protein